MNKWHSSVIIGILKGEVDFAIRTYSSCTVVSTMVTCMLYGVRTCVCLRGRQKIYFIMSIMGHFHKAKLILQPYVGICNNVWNICANYVLKVFDSKETELMQQPYIIICISKGLYGKQALYGYIVVAA